ncbi:MAG: hypothetical protein ABIQ18_46865 [Umezawaea sp.]
MSTIERQVSAEIASTATPTTSLLDGSARQRRDLRILARRLNGITAKYGVTLEEAIQQAQATARPVLVTLKVAESVIEPVAVQTPAPIAPAESVPAPTVESTTTAVSPVVRTVRSHHFAYSDPRNEVNDHVCRGCGASGHFGYLLDRTPCTAPYVGAESLGEVA